MGSQIEDKTQQHSILAQFLDIITRFYLRHITLRRLILCPSSGSRKQSIRGLVSGGESCSSDGPAVEGQRYTVA
jgi:hypothetical protein